MAQCYKCKFEIELGAHEKVHRNDECPNCYTDLRCCKMCSYYDAKSYNECREPSADRIVEKEKKNFCDFFELNNKKNSESDEDDALKKANSLFK